MLFEETATNGETPFTITGLQPVVSYSTYQLHHSVGAAFVTETGIGTSVCFFRFAASVSMASDLLTRIFFSHEHSHDLFDMCVRPMEMWVLSAGRVFYAGPHAETEEEEGVSERED